MAAININDLNDAKLDVDHIAEVATSNGDTAIDRKGNVKPTLRAALSSIASINNRGPWELSTVYALKDIASNSGTWYVCVTSHTSGATFSADEPTKWRVYQGVISGDLAASSGAGLVGWIRSAAGSVATTIAKWLGWQATNIFEFMTDAQIADVQAGTGGIDVTVAFNAAAATGKKLIMPAGGYYITDRISLVNGQILQGDGRTQSYFIIKPTFNMAATGILRLGTGEPGAQVFDVGFRFTQVDQAVRANVTNYPYAIDMNGIPRAVADRIRIEKGWNGIDARGNCGGSYLGFLEIGTFNTGLAHDGSLDFFHGGHWHFWPFGINGLVNLPTVYYDGVGVAATLGASDGFNVDSICTFSQKILITASAGTAIPMQISKLQLDGDGARLLVSGGVTQIGASYSTKSSAAVVPAIDVSAGTLVLTSHRISTNANSNELHTSGTGRLFVMGGEFNFVNLNNPVARSDGGLLSLNGISMIPDIGSAYTQPHCVQASGVLQVKSCNWVTVGGGSGIAVNYVSDQFENVCQNNNFGSWQYGFPASYLLGQYSQNHRTISTDVINDLVTGLIKTKRLVVTADGAGNYVGAHGVANLNLKLLSVSAYSKGGSSEAIPRTVVHVDGTNVSISGAIAGARARITLVYTETQDAW